MKTRGHAAVAVGCALLTAVPVGVHAQTARSGGSAGAQLMQQLASERTALQAENDKLKKQLAGITKDRDTLKTGQQAVERRARDASAALASSNSQRAATDQELTQTKAKMQELIGKFRETVQSMRQVETEDTANRQALAVRNQELQTCVDRNVALYKLNDEVLTHIDKQGAWSRVASLEPFTKIKRVQNENLVVEYKAKAADQRAAAPSKLSVPEGAPAGSPAAGSQTRAPTGSQTRTPSTESAASSPESAAAK